MNEFQRGVVAGLQDAGLIRSLRQVDDRGPYTSYVDADIGADRVRARVTTWPENGGVAVFFFPPAEPTTAADVLRSVQAKGGE
jgi:hypothetical protein